MERSKQASLSMNSVQLLGHERRKKGQCFHCFTIIRIIKNLKLYCKNDTSGIYDLSIFSLVWHITSIFGILRMSEKSGIRGKIFYFYFHFTGKTECSFEIFLASLH